MCCRSRSAGSAASSQRGMQGDSQDLVGNLPSRCFPTFPGLGILGDGDEPGGRELVLWHRDRGAARGRVRQDGPHQCQLGRDVSHLSIPGVPTDSPLAGAPKAHHICRMPSSISQRGRPGLDAAGAPFGRRVAPRAASQALCSCCRGRSHSGSSRLSLRAASHLLYYFSI